MLLREPIEFARRPTLSKKHPMETSNTTDQIEFFQALADGDIKAVRTFVARDVDILNSYDVRNFGATPLTVACFNNRLDLVETLIELGADPNRRSGWKMGPWSPLHCAIFRRDKALAEFLLAHGALLDVHTAAGLGNCSEVERLLDADSSRVMERGGDGCYPLHFADSVDVARLLLERGADRDGRCIDHHSTPAQYLCSIRPEVARFLFAQGAVADIFSAILCGDDERVEALLAAEPTLINARINQSFFPPGTEHNVHNILTFTVGVDATPLHAAARANQREAVSQLIRLGLSPNVRGGYDQATPLHTAAWNNCALSAAALIDNGADIDARSGRIHNNSPAGWAIVSGADDAFNLLLERGAECFPWFLDDARDASVGRFNPVSQATPEQRHRILARLESALGAQ